MKNRIVFSLSLLAFTLALASCANLSHINTFATVSVDALSSKNAIGYSFEQSCREFDCQLKSSAPIYYYPTKNEMGTAFGNPPACNCDSFKNADKTLSTINAVLTAYLTGLADLSDGKAVNYNYNDLVSAINKNEATFKLSDVEVTALGKVATIVSNDLMNTYRRNKLKTIVAKADTPFQFIMAAYIRGMGYFKNIVLKNDQDYLVNWYSDYLVKNDATLSPMEKARIFQDYKAQKAKIVAYQALVDNYIAALKTIQAGHAELVKNAAALSVANAKEVINAYSADIFSLISEFKQLKSKQ